MRVVGKRARVLVQRYGPFVASLMAFSILAALLLVLFAVWLLAQPPAPPRAPEVFENPEVLAALRENVSKAEGLVGDLRGRASLLAADRARVRDDPALVKTLRMIPLLRAHEQDFRRLIRSMGATPFDESPLPLVERVVPSANGGAPSSSSSAAASSFSSSSASLASGANQGGGAPSSSSSSAAASSSSFSSSASSASGANQGRASSSSSIPSFSSFPSPPSAASISGVNTGGASSSSSSASSSSSSSSFPSFPSSSAAAAASQEGGATEQNADQLDSEVATCARRDCARRTQCRYLELEKRWREVQGTSKRYDPRVERFLDVPWELDPAKIWYLFPEVHSCSSQRRAGPLYDGGKNLCLPVPLRAPCVVYSIGTWDDTTFESSPILSACQVHAFEIDPAPRKRIQHVFDAHRNWTLHPYGIAARDDSVRGVRGLGGVVKELGHTSIDVLKVDIEGGEFELVEALAKNKAVSFDQFLVEVHNPRLEQMLRMTRSLDAMGLVPFAREANTLAAAVQDATGGHSCCFEYSFVRLPFLSECADKLLSARSGGRSHGQLAWCADPSGSLEHASDSC